MRVLALAICGSAAALQPARNARRQSLAVRQAPRGVRERAIASKSAIRTLAAKKIDLRRRAATPTARPARRSTRRPRSRTPTTRSTRCSTPSARTRACARSSWRCSTRAARSPARCVVGAGHGGGLGEHVRRRPALRRRHRGRDHVGGRQGVRGRHLRRERGGARDRQVQPQGRVHDLLGPPRRVVDRRQQLGRRHDHRRVRTPRPLLSLLSSSASLA